MPFGILDEYRVVTRRVESKLQEAQAFLHNSQAFLHDLVEGPDSPEKQNLMKLQTLLGHAVKALNEVNN